MFNSANLNLPYIAAGQAQKHITYNEAIRNLDAMVQINIIDKDLTAPPATPTHGERYIPATGSTDEWAGKDGQIALFIDNGWVFYVPNEGWLAWVADEDILLAYNGNSWIGVSSASGNSSGGISNITNSSANAAQTRVELAEDEIPLSGASTDSTITVPGRAIVFGVSTRTTQAITGATSYDCGIAGESNKYGGLLSIVLNSINSGVTGPTAFYANTPIIITANGGNFTGGKIRIAIHYLLCNTPNS